MSELVSGSHGNYYHVRFHRRIKKPFKVILRSANKSTVVWHRHHFALEDCSAKTVNFSPLAYLRVGGENDFVAGVPQLEDGAARVRPPVTKGNEMFTAKRRNRDERSLLVFSLPNNVRLSIRNDWMQLLW
jgi:hypothetical protein